MWPPQHKPRTDSAPSALMRRLNRFLSRRLGAARPSSCRRSVQGLTVPLCLPERWVVDCKSVGNGEKALVYLGRYLYRGVIQERDILRCADGQVTFRYRDSASGKNTTRTLGGAHFLWLVLQHVKPQGISALTQLWFAPSQLQAPPAAGAVAHGAQARRDGVLPGGHVTIHAASIEPTPQTAVPALRSGDGDRASAYRTLGIQGWRGRGPPVRHARHT